LLQVPLGAAVVEAALPALAVVALAESSLAVLRCPMCLVQLDQSRVAVQP